MGNNIIVQEFDVKVKGKGIFAIYGDGVEWMVPMFGFNKDGTVMSRIDAKKNGYASLEQKWVDDQVVLAADYFRESEDIKEDSVYIAVVKRSDAPNEIGIAMHSSPMWVENSSITVSKSEYNL